MPPVAIPDPTTDQLDPGIPLGSDQVTSTDIDQGTQLAPAPPPAVPPLIMRGPQGQAPAPSGPPLQLLTPEQASQREMWRRLQYATADQPIAQTEQAVAAALRFQAQRQYQQDLAAGTAPAEALAKVAPLLFGGPKQGNLGQAASFIRATTPKPVPVMTPYQTDLMKFRREQAANKTVNVGPTVDRIHKLEKQLADMAVEQGKDFATGPLADEIGRNLASLRTELQRAQGRATMGPATRNPPISVTPPPAATTPDPSETAPASTPTVTASTSGGKRVFKDKTGKKFIYIGTAKDPKTDRNPDNWQEQ